MLNRAERTEGGKMLVRAGLVLLMFASLLVGFSAGANAQGQGGGDPSGVWLTQAGDAKVRVRSCGAGICGSVVWLRDPIDPDTGQAARDSKNPNPALRQRPIVGLVLFEGMQPTAPSRWSGRIYNADDGQHYASNIAMTGPNSLRVEGCVGALCGNEVWSRSN